MLKANDIYRIKNILTKIFQKVVNLSANFVIKVKENKITSKN